MREFTVRVQGRRPPGTIEPGFVGALEDRIGASSGTLRASDGHCEFVVELGDDAREDQALDVAEALMAEVAGSTWRAVYRARVV